jgi:transcriptional regulator with XRE-family HTH domain
MVYGSCASVTRRCYAGGVDVGKLGKHIRDQRQTARLSLRKMSALAGVSIPYLSQVERGLRKPSADILQGIARGLQVSAESLYVQAGMLEERPAPDVATAVRADRTISDRQRKVLLSIYDEFRREADEDESVGGSANGAAGAATKKKNANQPEKRASANKEG